ncbi:hypothetical protein Zmor_004431 [Zophobas morio]|uniref:Uncharacterized protein n=1 Tax=Zophobas morio TaxID=2755281 RepID=A0AA38LZP5_9CUCU|nr:hypothetical protein Zmor_004431 [Zophobas morio]
MNWVDASVKVNVESLVLLKLIILHISYSVSGCHDVFGGLQQVRLSGVWSKFWSLLIVWPPANMFKLTSSCLVSGPGHSAACHGAGH